MTRLGELLIDAQPGFACGSEDEHGIFQFRMNNVTNESALDLSKRRRVPADAHKKIANFVVALDDVLFNATNSPDNVGKSVLVPELNEKAVFSNHFIRLRTDRDRLIPAYLWRWLQWNFGRGVFSAMCRQWVNQATVSREALLALDMPLPPLDAQRRIAAGLEQADRVRSQRLRVNERLRALIPALFVEAFGDQDGTPTARLGEIAEISSGITKGRKTAEPTSPVPYLAVVNVQAGRLVLDPLKEIDATEAEIERYSLKDGDLVLTEGGDPDKLGRGTVWRCEVPLCLHQNHIFRVRVRPESKIEPDYLSAYLASWNARSYFLRSAKQTTGIASINMTQLRALPVLVPPLPQQRHFLDRVAAVKRQAASCEQQLAEMKHLMSSLQSRAFSGQF